MGTSAYDTSEKRRAPAWCDRILWSGVGGTVGPILYDACLNTVTSDHKPVKALYLYLPRRRAGEPGPRNDLTLTLTLTVTLTLTLTLALPQPLPLPYPEP